MTEDKRFRIFIVPDILYEKGDMQTGIDIRFCVSSFLSLSL